MDTKIRLIASDMDGTLLDDEKRLPADFFATLDALLERGITFAVSSGRTYSALEHLFPEEYVRRMSFICDNGACVVHNGEVIGCDLLSRGIYGDIVRFCEREGGFLLVACAKNGVYHLDMGEKFSDEVGRFYKYHTAVKSLLDIEDDFYKLAVCDTRGTLAHGKPLFDAAFGDKLNVQASGEVWMDVMAGGVSKGRALKKLQQSLGVSREETMAFGDYFNDVDMLQAAEWSFCMENGHEDVKKLCRFTAPSNNEDGVIKSINKYVLT